MSRTSLTRWGVGVVLGALVAAAGALVSTLFLQFLPERREPLQELAAAVCLLLGLLGGFLIFRRVWSKPLMSAAPGLCERCGYNLTGNTSGVCPECGTAVSANSVTSISSCSTKKQQEQTEGTE